MPESDKECMPSSSQDLQMQNQRYVGLVINTIVHSLNNAIGLIRGYADLSVRATDPKSRAYPYLNHIIEGADAIKELVAKMRVFGKQVKRDLKPVEIGPIVEGAVNSFKEAVGSSVKAELNIEPVCPAIPADAGQIRQAVINLCDNAYHAASDNGGTIEVSLKEVDVDASFAGVHQELKAGRYIKLTVRDTGKGIDAGILNRIFEPFITTKNVEEHAGLGLTIVQSIVKGHKGKIVVENKPGEGAAFDIYLPLANNDKKEEG